MIYIAIEHINGQIDGLPFIIKKNDIEKYLLEGYMIFSINTINNTIKEII